MVGVDQGACGKAGLVDHLAVFVQTGDAFGGLAVVLRLDDAPGRDGRAVRSDAGLLNDVLLGAFVLVHHVLEWRGVDDASGELLPSKVGLFDRQLHFAFSCGGVGPFAQEIQ
ncbi:MAG: hypothetical protein Q7J66_06800 [Hydrogenophaga sp.]|nr:hypothetical protein [Hydrogenophaga sp.]